MYVIIAGLTHPQLVGKTGASVQIVQQKIGKQIGVQQIQQLIKQQQQAQQAAAAAQQQAAAAQQHAQIITAPAGTTVSGQTIIATTQLITPANMHGKQLALYAFSCTRLAKPVSVWPSIFLQFAYCDNLEGFSILVSVGKCCRTTD